jgi:hypothetical protein
MIVRYRLIEKYFKDEKIWRIWGALYDNCSDMFPDSKILVRSIPDDDRRLGRHIDQRIDDLAISLEDAERIFAHSEYADYFRLRPQIETVEGKTHKEVRQRLWERLFAPGKAPYQYGREPTAAAVTEQQEEYEN